MPSIKDVTDAELASSGIRAPELGFLSKDPGLVDILLFQPLGVIVADDAGVRSADSGLMSAQMSGFFQKAADLGVDLAACPEYACPWDVLTTNILQGVFPTSGKLWAVACQAVSIERLREFERAMSGHCKVVHEWPEAGATGRFMDCLCLLFASQDLHGAPIRVVLIQRKTHAMGGTTYEYEGLIPGEVLYRFGGQSQWKLVTLLCSDVLAPRFQEDLVPQLRYDTLLLHLQLNDNPSSPGYRAYRESCCTYLPRNTEILCLNWARGTTLRDAEKESPLIQEPKTIWFRSVSELDLSDEGIAHNHHEGCFFSYVDATRSAAFVFSPDPQLFHLKTTKPSVAGLATNSKRTGPSMVERFDWDGHVWRVSSVASNDRFKSYWLDPHSLLRPFLEQYTDRQLDSERLIQFCIGHGLDVGWSEVCNLLSFRFAPDDTSRRLRLCWSDDGDGYAYRNECLSTFQGFVAAVSNSGAFSNRLTEFKTQDFTVDVVQSPQYKAFRNLHVPEGRSATAVFLGLAPAKSKLNEVRTRLTNRLRDVNEDAELMAVWYLEPDGSLVDHMDTIVPMITGNPNASPVDISNPDL